MALTGQLLAFVTRALQEGERVCLATVVESAHPRTRPGAKLALRGPASPGPHRTSREDGVGEAWSEGSLEPPELDAQVRERAGQLLGQASARPPGRVTPPKERMAHLLWSDPVAGLRVRVFLELLEPPPRLLLVGAGQDALPLCRIGSQAGFEVLVADHRPAFARRERFPEAREVVCTVPGELPQPWLLPNTFAVVMNHHFLRDAEALGRLLPSPVPYIGVLGPRLRTERLLARIEAQRGSPLAPEELARIYSPVGLDIGGESPGAIALGVVAEVMALRYGRPAPHLRERRGPLHPDRLDPVGAPVAAAGASTEATAPRAGATGTPAGATGVAAPALEGTGGPGQSPAASPAAAACDG